MSDTLYPGAAKETAERRRALAPDAEAAFRAFSQAVFRDGALPRKTKELIAVAVAHVTQCPYCIRGHTKAAARHGAGAEEIMEAIWIASEMRAGAAFAHSAIALEALGDAGATGSRMRGWHEAAARPMNRRHNPDIRLRRAYDAPDPSDGRRILIDRIWPRGVSKDQLGLDAWMKDLAPTSALRAWFGHAPSRWEAFKDRYARELDGRADAVEQLLALCRRGTVTLVFAARDTQHCNAVALRDYLLLRLAGSPAPGDRASGAETDHKPATRKHPWTLRPHPLSCGSPVHRVARAGRALFSWPHSPGSRGLIAPGPIAHSSRSMGPGGLVQLPQHTVVLNCAA